MTTRANPQSDALEVSEWRLPGNLTPVRYEIRLAPDLEAATFSGKVRIECSVSQPTASVVLNAAELEIDDVAVEVAGRPIGVLQVSASESSERLTIALDEPLSESDVAFVEIRFRGVLNDRLRGFYRSRLEPLGSEDRTETIAVTDLQPTHARRVFPCFDEPDYKAVFSISVDVPPGMGVWSNWCATSEESLGAPGSGARRVHFGDTIKMSTYLVAVVVGPLSQTAPFDVDGTPVSVVHAPGKEPLTAFAIEAAAHAIRFYSEWFAIPYPAAKLDMVALPDFDMGAMENLGCVTFRETALLVDPERASLAEMQRVSQVVAHEIAHMWFGDLVTMRWWNGVWLNEAFATFMEISCCDDFRPEWDMWTCFGTMRERAMAIDGLRSTRPIEYPVGRPEEAEGMFDWLTYDKGAGVLRMLERYVGPEQFREGIRLYLKRYSYGNADTPDLWRSLEDVTGHPVSSIMDTWLHQGGFPLLHVVETKSAQGGRTGRFVTISQEPFTFSEPDGRAPSAIGESWEVPVLLRTFEDTGRGPASGGSPEGVVKVLLEGADLTVEPDDGGAPVLANAGGSGVYRVQYPPEHLLALASRAHELETLERFYLFSDTWASVVSGRSELATFLSLSRTLVRERDPDVWGQVTTPLAFMDRAVPDDLRPDLATFTRALVGRPFEILGWESAPADTDRLRALRAQLLATLGTVGADPYVRSLCHELHDALSQEGIPLDPALAPAVVEVVAASGGPEEFEAFLDRYRHGSTPQEANRYLLALGSFQDPELARRAFELARGEVRSQSAPYLVAQLLSNRSTGAATWERVTRHWEELLDRFPQTLITRMLDGCKLLCRTEDLASEVTGFLSTHPFPSAQRTVDQIAERVAVNAAFAARLASHAGAELRAALELL